MHTLLDKTYFDIFGLDEAYALDQGGLRQRFRELQRKYHPDNFASASEVEKRVSAQYAAHINEAFTTLRDPVLRARYILARHGVSQEEKSHMDNAFLIEQMELREQLEAALSSQDGLDALVTLSDKISRDYADKTAQLEQALDASEGPELEQADRLVRELQFFRRIQQEIEEAEEAYL